MVLVARDPTDRLRRQIPKLGNFPNARSSNSTGREIVETNLSHTGSHRTRHPTGCRPWGPYCVQRRSFPGTISLAYPVSVRISHHLKGDVFNLGHSTALGAEAPRGLVNDPRVSIVSIVSSVHVIHFRAITLDAGPGRTFLRGKDAGLSIEFSYYYHLSPRRYTTSTTFSDFPVRH